MAHAHTRHSTSPLRSNGKYSGMLFPRGSAGRQHVLVADSRETRACSANTSAGSLGPVGLASSGSGGRASQWWLGRSSVTACAERGPIVPDRVRSVVARSQGHATMQGGRGAMRVPCGHARAPVMAVAHLSGRRCLSHSASARLVASALSGVDPRLPWCCLVASLAGGPAARFKKVTRSNSFCKAMAKACARARPPPPEQAQCARGRCRRVRTIHVVSMGLVQAADLEQIGVVCSYRSAFGVV